MHRFAGKCTLQNEGCQIFLCFYAADRQDESASKTGSCFFTEPFIDVIGNKKNFNVYFSSVFSVLSVSSVVNYLPSDFFYFTTEITEDTEKSIRGSLNIGKSLNILLNRFAAISPAKNKYPKSGFLSSIICSIIN